MLVDGVIDCSLSPLLSLLVHDLDALAKLVVDRDHCAHAESLLDER